VCIILVLKFNRETHSESYFSRTTCSQLNLEENADVICGAGDSHKEFYQLKSYFIGYEQLDYDTANDRCKKAGGHLAVVESEVEMEKIFATTAYTLAEKPILFGYNSGRGGWVDGSLSTYMNLQDGSSPTDDEQCLSFIRADNAGQSKWKYTDCSEKNYYLCESKETSLFVFVYFVSINLNLFQLC
jgi:Lectin C-type domain.